MHVLSYLFFMFAGYLSGSILYSYLIPRWFCHLDITKLSDDGKMCIRDRLPAGPVFKFFLFLLSFANQLRHRHRFLIFIQRHQHHITGVYQFPCPVQPFHKGIHSDFHGASSYIGHFPLEMCIRDRAMLIWLIIGLVLAVVGYFVFRWLGGDKADQPADDRDGEQEHHAEKPACADHLAFTRRGGRLTYRLRVGLLLSCRFGLRGRRVCRLRRSRLFARSFRGGLRRLSLIHILLDKAVDW